MEKKTIKELSSYSRKPRRPQEELNLLLFALEMCGKKNQLASTTFLHQSSSGYLLSSSFVYLASVVPYNIVTRLL
jgi:hypothetical protein